jgi:hypothetical protein
MDLAILISANTLVALAVVSTLWLPFQIDGKDYTAKQYIIALVLNLLTIFVSGRALGWW